MLMDDLVLDAEEDIASCEETSSEDVKICFICGDVGEEKKLAVCSRCNDGAMHTYCMRVMLQKVPEGGWLCEECQAAVEIEIEKKKLEEIKGNVVMISMENKVDAANVAHKESNEHNQGNDIDIRRKEEDAGIINSLEKCNNDVSSISKAKDVSNMVASNKRLNRQSDIKNYEQIEHVKVCDICGDVGEEEKLAICSRCNYGAEHVYCMQVMMEKVPEVMWLCEACQTEVEVAKESVKPEKIEVIISASKLEPFEGRTNKPVNNANSGSSSEDEMKADNVGSKHSNMRHQPNVMATKRTEEDALKNKAPPLHGSLLKSTFNNLKAPKVKPLVIEVPPKPRNSEESLSSLRKQEESMSTLVKSIQFKKPNSNEPANKGKSSLLLHAEEPSIMTSQMSRNVTNKRGTYISGYPSVAASLLVPVPSKLESAAQHLNKRNKVDSLGVAFAQSSTNSPVMRGAMSRM